LIIDISGKLCDVISHVKHDYNTIIAHFPTYFMKDDYDGSHFTPDVFCPFCNQNVKKHAKNCIGKRFPFTSKDKAENSERLRKLYKKR